MADKDKRVQVSVLLDPDTHKEAKMAAMNCTPSVSLTGWIETLIRKALEKSRRKVA